jgi:hypothetical protein
MIPVSLVFTLVFRIKRVSYIEGHPRAKDRVHYLPWTVIGLTMALVWFTIGLTATYIFSTDVGEHLNEKWL